jgi:hypothetical protein
MWRLRLLDKREWLAIAFVGAVVVSLTLLMLTGKSPRPANFGFGPDWHCMYPGKGEPICFKDAPPQK